MLLLWLSPSRIYNKYLFSISIRSRKKKLGSCCISFLIHPGRSPGMILLCLSVFRIYKTFSISILSRKKKLGCCSISFLVHPRRSPGMMLLCLSASRIYNTFSISIRRRKKKLGSCSISFLVHPGRSPGMMLLCLSGSRIYNTLRIVIRSRKKIFSAVLYPFWFTQVEVLACCYYAWALLGYITSLSLAFRFVAEKNI